MTTTGSGATVVVSGVATEAQVQTATPTLGTPNTFVVIGNQEVDDQARSGAVLTAGFWLDREQTIGIECSGFFLEPHASHFTADSSSFPGLAQPFVNPFGTPLVPPSTRPTTFKLALGMGLTLNRLPPPLVQPVPPGLKPGSGVEDVFIIGGSQGLSGTQTLSLAVTPPIPPLLRTVTTQESFQQTNQGAVDVYTSTNFGGAEADFRVNAGRGSHYRVDLLGGFRFLELKDQLHISSITSLTSTDQFNFIETGPNITPIVSNNPPVTSSGAFYPSPQIVPSGVLQLSDLFETRNQFYGGQIGVEAEFLRGCWSVDLRGKLALGVMHQQADVFGSADLFTPTGVSHFAGGLYAQDTNGGSHRRDVFGVVPELGINLGYQVTRHLRATVGYSGLFALGCVIRPGDQLDRTLNPNLIPALGGTPTANSFPARPAFTFKDTDYWAQGLNAGLEFDF
jgi:hypothetical protein